MPSVTISDAALKKSATTYEKELLLMPVIAAQDTLQHMTPRAGVRGRVVLSEMLGNLELGPYKATRKSESDIQINPRTLEVFLGSAKMDFDPNELADTVFGSLVTQGDALKNTDIVKAVLDLLAGSLGKGLNKSIWTAKRNDTGTKTSELFNGFDTITDTEITATNISVANGNEHDFAAAIDSTTAVDALKEFYFSASDELRTQQVKLFLPVDIYNAYCECYKTETGAIAYNTQYDKTFLEGSQNLCELVPLASKKGTKYLHMGPKSNFIYGYGAGLADEHIMVDRFDSFLLTFAASMFFGTQFRSIQPEYLNVGKLHTD